VTNARYAIYFVPAPDSLLYRFGASALGYDVYSGREIPLWDGEAADDVAWRRLTAEPRRYGFHATLKAPFRLRATLCERDLAAEFLLLGRELPSIRQCPVGIELLDGFAAVVPAEASEAASDLADACVQTFDRFRAEPTDAERQRRLRQPLTARQREHLNRWGYPYVFEDFRFHMTLTGRLDAEDVAPVLALCRSSFRRHAVPGKIDIDNLALLRQDGEDGQFQVIHTIGLR
jgi:hypothetical protein